jgi:hypothetical protein
MHTKIEYDPRAKKPYSVHKLIRLPITGTTWINLEYFDSEEAAVFYAKRVSEQPDMPCRIAEFELGKEIKH